MFYKVISEEGEVLPLGPSERVGGWCEPMLDAGGWSPRSCFPEMSVGKTGYARYSF